MSEHPKNVHSARSGFAEGKPVKEKVLFVQIAVTERGTLVALDTSGRIWDKNDLIDNGRWFLIESPDEP